MRVRCRRTWLGLAAIAVLGLASLALTGCIESSNPTKIANTGIGSAQVQQGVTSWDMPQTLTEYGVFYSTDRDAVVAVDASGEAGLHVYPNPSIVLQPGVSRVQVVTSSNVPSSTVGTLTVSINGLTSGRTYYFRFYSIGHDTSANEYRALYPVTAFATLSHDASLASIKASTGTLAPKFKSSKHSYKLTISASQKSTTVTVKPSASASTVKMQVGGGAWSVTSSTKVKLNKGQTKTLNIKVIATDGTTKITYTVNVSRKKK